jgi:hypothetical protein
MAAFNKFNIFTRDLAAGVHNFTTNTIKAAFTNTAPVNTNATLSNITQLSSGGGYTGGAGGGLTLDSVTLTTTGGVAKVSIADEVFTATGTVGPFRYVVIYNDTPTSPADPLIGWYDYGQSITLNVDESLTIDFDDANGVLTIT